MDSIVLFTQELADQALWKMEKNTIQLPQSTKIVNDRELLEPLHVQSEE